MEIEASCALPPSRAERYMSYADGVCQWSVALLGLIPFVLPHHYQPYSTFVQEASALLLGLFAFVPVAINAWRGRLQVPKAVAVPVCLVLVACLQLLVMDFPYWQDVAIFILFMLWGGLLTLVGRYLASKPEVGVQTLRLLAWSVLLGALFNVFAVWAQILGVAANIPFVFFNGDSSNIVGNIAQANMLATYFGLGICALVYLEAIEDFPTAVSWPFLLILVGSGFWSGSRMFILELAVMAVLAFFPARDGADPVWRRLRTSLVLVVLFYCAWYVAKVSGLTELLFSPNFDRTGRIVSLQMGGSWIRLGLWKAAFEMAWDNPLLGVGVNNFDWESFNQMKRFPTIAYEKAGYLALGDAENAHNAVLNIAAEMGFVAAAVVLVWMVRWAIGALRRQDRVEEWLLVAAGAALLIHSMLEYPLWYSFFLGPMCLIAGWRSQTLVMPQKLARPVGGAVGVLTFAGLAILVLTSSQYIGFERIVNLGPLAGTEAAAVRRSSERILSNLETSSLLAGKASYGRAFNFPLKPFQIQEKVSTCRRAMRWEPDRAIVFRCAVLIALGGNEQEALAIMDRAVLAFPAESLTVSLQLSELARDLPELRRFENQYQAILLKWRQKYPGTWNRSLMPSSTPIL